MTVAGNTAAEGDAMYNRHGSPSFFNAILWGNPSVTGNQIVNEGDTATFSYSLLEGSGGSGGWDPAYGIDGGNNIDADPLFASLFAGDLRLQPGSPAIDVGYNAATYIQSTDLVGNPRVIDTVVDMGAYEFDGDATAINDPVDPPAAGRIALRSVYPNPFNPSVTVAFELDRRRRVQVNVYDVQGKLVRAVLDEVRNTGSHGVKSNATDNNGRRVASGMYFVEVKSDA